MEYVTFKNVIPTFELTKPKFELVKPEYDNFQLNVPYYKYQTDSSKQDSDIWKSFKSDSSFEKSTNNEFTIDLSQSIQKHLGEIYSQNKRHQQGYSDCSSFVGKVLKDAGINVFKGLPTAQMMYDNTRLKTVNKAQAGDLIFFKGTDARGPHKVTHVGIVTEVDSNGNPIKMAHASSKKYGKSVIIDYNSGYWNKFNPIIKRIS